MLKADVQLARLDEKQRKREKHNEQTYAEEWTALRLLHEHDGVIGLSQEIGQQDRVKTAEP